jgi:PKD repeat protein
MDKRVILTFISTILISVLLLGIKSCKKECIPPIIVLQDSIVELGAEVSFSCKTESDENVTWNFGDGTTAEGIEVKHSFKAVGTYEVTAMNSKECISNMVKITIASPPKKEEPKKIILNIIVPEGIAAEEMVSIATDSPLSQFNWNVIETNETSTESSISIVFPKQGVYTIKLEGNGENIFGDTSISVTVGPKKVGPIKVPTILGLVGPKAGMEGKSVNFSCTTPYITQYTWTIKETGQSFNSRSIKTAFEKEGVYTISLIVTGNAGGKPFSLSKSTSIAIAKKPDDGTKPCYNISDSEFSDLFVSTANTLSNQDSDASDIWKDKIAPCGCNKPTIVSVNEEGVQLERITIEQFKKKQLISNTYEVIGVTKIQRGFDNSISQITINVKKN